MSDAETSYERDDARTDRDEDDSGYRCPHCGEMNGGGVCNDCKHLREKEWNGLEDSTIAILQIAREAHDARWDDDTTQTRKKLAQALRKEFEAMFRTATGNVPS